MSREQGIGPNAAFIEASLDAAQPNYGFRDGFYTTWEQWLDKNFAALSADPELVTVSTDFRVVKWDHDATAADFIRHNFVIPRWFPLLEGSEYGIKLIVPARKVDATADENSDLKLQCGASWIDSDDSSDGVDSLATAAVSDALPASVTDTDGQNFTNIVIDLGAQLKTESASLLAGRQLALKLGPNETVGSTDMDLQIMQPVLEIRRHAVNQVPATEA